MENIVDTIYNKLRENGEQAFERDLLNYQDGFETTQNLKQISHEFNLASLDQMSANKLANESNKTVNDGLVKSASLLEHVTRTMTS
jgi:hypothetical protein